MEQSAQHKTAYQGNRSKEIFPVELMVRNIKSLSPDGCAPGIQGEASADAVSEQGVSSGVADDKVTTERILDFIAEERNRRRSLENNGD